MDGVIQHHVTTDPLAVRVLETPEEFLLMWSSEYLDARWHVEPVKTIDGIEGATTGYSTRSAGALRKALSEAAGMDTEQCYI